MVLPSILSVSVTFGIKASPSFLELADVTSKLQPSLLLLDGVQARLCYQGRGCAFLTPQTVTGQIKALEERMKGKLTKRNGRTVEPTELGQLVFKYADRMFGLSYEMLDIVNYSQHSNILFEVGVADALSKRLVSKVLMTTVPEDNSIHLRCYESTHELLLERLSQHKLDMILSDCPVDSTQSPGLYSKKLGESSMSFFASSDIPDVKFPEILEKKKLLIPASRTAMGRKVIQWFDRQGLQPDVLGEFDDVALMKAFARYRDDVIFWRRRFTCQKSKMTAAYS